MNRSRVPCWPARLQRGWVARAAGPAASTLALWRRCAWQVGNRDPGVEELGRSLVVGVREVVGMHGDDRRGVELLGDHPDDSAEESRPDLGGVVGPAGVEPPVGVVEDQDRPQLVAFDDVEQLARLSNALPRRGRVVVDGLPQLKAELDLRAHPTRGEGEALRSAGFLGRLRSPSWGILPSGVEREPAPEQMSSSQGWRRDTVAPGTWISRHSSSRVGSARNHANVPTARSLSRRFAGALLRSTKAVKKAHRSRGMR
jgi:hypothetical protein